MTRNLLLNEEQRFISLIENIEKIKKTLPDRVLKEPNLEVHKVMGKPILLHESEFWSSTNVQEEKSGTDSAEIHCITSVAQVQEVD